MNHSKILNTDLKKRIDLNRVIENIRNYIITMRPYLLFVSGITGIAGLSLGSGLTDISLVILAFAFFLFGRIDMLAVRKFLEQSVKFHRIRRCQRAIFVAPGSHDARCATGSCSMSAMRPDLAREPCDRGLARSAGDRNHRLRLPSVKRRCR